VEQWLQAEVDTCRQIDMSLVLSIKLLSGNNMGPVTALQLENWGKLFAGEPYASALLMRKYDEAYFGGDGIAGALSTIAAVVGERPDVSG